MKRGWNLLPVALASLTLCQAASAVEPVIVADGTKLQLYGFVRLDGTYDLKGSNADAGDWGSFLQTQPIDGSAQANKHGDTYLTARTSRLGVKGTIADEVSFKLEGDFNGTTAEGGRPGRLGTNSLGFRIRHAYLSYGGWLAGQTWSNFEDLPSLQETIQFNPPLTGVTPRQPQIRYTLAPAAGQELSFSLENAQSQTFSGSDFTKGLDFTGKWSLSGDWGHVALRAVGVDYRTDTGSTRRSTYGYEAAISGSVNASHNDTIVYGLFAGDGGGRYLWGSLLEGAVDNGSTISKFKSTAYHVGYTHNWTSALRTNVAWSAIQFKDNPNAIPNLQNKRLTQLHLNLIAAVAKNTEAGIEYADGRRKVMNPAVDATDNPLGKDTGREQRINVMVQTSF
jgi:hypothetical protein